MLFDVALAIVSVIAGMVGAVVGFGIGSLLTPLLAAQAGLKLAVAMVSIPHVAGTAVRFWQMRRAIDRHLLLTFGLASAAGGLIGALLGIFLQSALMTFIFAGLLIFSGLAGLTGLNNRMRFHGWAAWVAGALSGLFGGLVGNQGGIRSAALLGFEIKRDAFIATATAVALLVDGARLPVYLWTRGGDILAQWPRVLLMTLCVVVGTFIGRALLSRIPESAFRRIVSIIVLVLGCYMAWRAWNDWA